MQQQSKRYESLPDKLSLHVGDEMQLLDRARISSEQTEIILAPVELHRRNIQRRLREAELPRERFRFIDAVDMSEDLLDTRGISTKSIDRIDRLSLIRRLLDESMSSLTVSLPVGISTRDSQHIEQIRAEVETITNYHPERLTAWSATVEELSEPIDADTEELLELALDIERGLRAQTGKVVTDGDCIRSATWELSRTDGEVWLETYSDIERVSLFGLSTISATYADFLNAVASTTSTEVHIHFREATGPYLKDRLPALFDISEPGTEVFQ